MGNDGGSIPTRRELVKSASRAPTLTDLKEKQKEHLAHRWSQCPISHKALHKPIVSDCAGNLYNKDAVIQYLLPDIDNGASGVDKAEAEAFIEGRIRGLKDVVEVLFETELDSKTADEKLVCPVTGKELGPAVKAVYLVPCGHAFSKEAIEQMKGGEMVCVQCNTVYEARDVIPILPSTEADKTSVIERMETLRGLGLTHALKKDKSATGGNGSKKRKAKDTDAVKNGAVEKTSTAVPKADTGIKNSATASLTARVLEEEEARKKKRRVVDQENDNIKSLYSTGKNGSSDGKQRNADFMTRGYSIPATAVNSSRSR